MRFQREIAVGEKSCVLGGVVTGVEVSQRLPREIDDFLRDSPGAVSVSVARQNGVEELSAEQLLRVGVDALHLVLQTEILLSVLKNWLDSSSTY